MLCTFWFRKLLRATTACTFCSKSVPKLVCFVHVDLEVCFVPQHRALFRHLSVQSGPNLWRVLAFWLGNVFRATSYLPRWLRTRRFSKPTFRPSGATKHWKTQCFATFLPFRAPASSFFWPSFSPLIFFLLFSSLLWFFPPLLFHLCILSEVWLLNFLRPCSYIMYLTKLSMPWILPYLPFLHLFACFCALRISSLPG